MKTAIYIENGTSQLVLTPESEWEKGLIEKLETNHLQAKIMVGSFYDCRGGWVKQSHCSTGGMFGSNDIGERSLIVRIGDKPEEPPTPLTSD
jgi:hypothetical protein